MLFLLCHLLVQTLQQWGGGERARERQAAFPMSSHSTISRVTFHALTNKTPSPDDNRAGCLCFPQDVWLDRGGRPAPRGQGGQDGKHNSGNGMAAETRQKIIFFSAAQLQTNTRNQPWYRKTLYRRHRANLARIVFWHSGKVCKTCHG